MAKCLKLTKTGEVKRFSENNRNEQETILQMIKNGWEYCPKSEWKTNRPKKQIKKETTEEVTDENKTKRGKKSVKK